MPSIMKISLTLLAVATTVLGAPANPTVSSNTLAAYLPGPTVSQSSVASAVATRAPEPTEFTYLTLPELYKRACHESVVMAPQGWFTTTICDNAPHCSVCVGCNAPVTKCS